jgi:hypothetical protein
MAAQRDADIRARLERLEQQVADVNRKIGEMGAVYVASLQGIQRTLDDIRREWNVRFADHASVLRQHEGRITTQERRTRR